MARLVITRGRRSQSSFSELEGGLGGQLTPQENLSGFEWSGDIAAGVTLEIRNKLRDGQVPTHYLILSQTPVPTIERSSTPWSQDYVYLRNSASTSTVTARVYFYKHRGALQ